MTEFIDTTQQLGALPRGAVVFTSDGMIAARFNVDHAVLFGDAQRYLWHDLHLPGVVIWHPDKPVPQWDPTPPPAIDEVEQLLDLPTGCVIRGVVGGVFEKFADARWYSTGGGRSISLDRLAAMLPARMIWHPDWSK